MKLTHEVEINLNVASESMKNCVSGHMQSWDIVTNKWGGCNGVPISQYKMKNHRIWVAVVAEARYSASLLDDTTVACFLAVQATKFDPIKTHDLVVECQSSGVPAQSTSEKALSVVLNVAWYESLRLIVPLTYWRICLTAWRWEVRGQCIYWQTWLTVKLISIHVSVRYWSPPTVIRYVVTSEIGSPSKAERWGPRTRDVEVGLHDFMENLWSRSEAYQDWLKMRIDGLRVASIPRKKLSGPNSRLSKVEQMESRTWATSVDEEPMIMMLLTYNMMATMEPEWCRIKKEESDRLLKKPNVSKKSCSNWNQARANYFNPQIARCN